MITDERIVELLAEAGLDDETVFSEEHAWRLVQIAYAEGHAAGCEKREAH